MLLFCFRHVLKCSTVFSSLVILSKSSVLNLLTFLLIHCRSGTNVSYWIQKLCTKGQLSLIYAIVEFPNFSLFTTSYGAKWQLHGTLGIMHRNYYFEWLLGTFYAKQASRWMHSRWMHSRLVLARLSTRRKKVNFSLQSEASNFFPRGIFLWQNEICCHRELNPRRRIRFLNEISQNGFNGKSMII